MTKIQTLTRRNLVLAALSVALLAALVLRPSETSTQRTAKLPELFPDLEVAQARAIVLTRVPAQPGQTPPAPLELRLEREGEEAWKLATVGGYPANPLRVRSLLEALEGARRKTIVTEREDTFAEYASTDGWVRVEVLGASEKSLARFDLGKSAGWPDSYVRMQVGDKPVVVRAYNLTSDKARMATDAWVDMTLWPGLTLPDVVKIDVFQLEEQRTISLERQGQAGEPDRDTGMPPAATWKMLAPKEATAETSPVENLVRAFTGMRFVEVAGRAEGAEAAVPFGLDKPRYRVVVVTSKGEAPGQAPPRRVLEVGRRLEKGDVGAPPGDAEAFYVRRQGEPWVFSVRATSLADFRKAPDELLPKPPAEAPPGEGQAPDDGTGDGDAMPPKDPDDGGADED